MRQGGYIIDEGISLGSLALSFRSGQFNEPGIASIRYEENSGSFWGLGYI